MNIEELNTQIEYLRETKNLIKEQLITKGQPVDDNTTFREYADKVGDILTAPTQPLGVQAYKRIEILDDQPDLINYYVQGVQTGEFADLNSYQIRFVYIDTVTEIPKTRILQIIDANPALMNISNPGIYYFSPDYTQAFIQVASSLGMYESLVGAFLETYNLTEEQLLQLNGWYANEDNTLVSTTHPIFEHTNINWAVRLTVQEYLMDTWGIDNVLDFIDLDTTNLNIILTKEDNVEDAINCVENINGDFLRNCTANEYQVAEGYTAFFHNGKVNGKYIPKCYIFSQSNLAGTFTYEYMCCYPASDASSSDLYEWKTKQQSILDNHPGLFEIYSNLSSLNLKTDANIRSYINSISKSDLAAICQFVRINGSEYLFHYGSEPGARIILTTDQQGNFEMDIITTHTISSSTTNIDVKITGVKDTTQDQFTILSFNLTSIKKYPGTYDATATASDIALDKIAYVNGQKITGSAYIINNDNWTSVHISGEPDMTDIDTNYIRTRGLVEYESVISPLRSYIISPDTKVSINVPVSKVVQLANITADKIKAGETILGITGTYAGSAMKEYASVTDMNNDITNISEGEVVKVDDGTTIDYYIKDTTMIKLVKESETMSPQEYTDANDIADEVLGN